MRDEDKVFALTTERGNVKGGASSFRSRRGLLRTFKLRAVDFDTIIGFSIRYCVEEYKVVGVKVRVNCR